jgi:hypothetical protein
MSVAKGCRLMGLAGSTCYDQPARVVDDTALVDAICAIRDEFEAYGYRRMGAALRQQGLVVNHKKLRRLMRDHDLQPKQRRRYVPPRTVRTMGRSSPIGRGISSRAAPTSCGSGTSPTSRCPGASSTSPSFSMPGHGWSSATASAGRSMPGSRSRRFTPPSSAERRRPAASTTLIAARSMSPCPIGSSSPHTASLARWADTAIRTTTPPPRAS